jgi:hypothetical protein
MSKVSVARSSSRSEMSSGRVSTSIVAVYEPGPGSGTSNTPSSSVVTVAISFPAASSTVTSTPSTSCRSSFSSS